MQSFPWEPPEEPRHRPSPDDSAPPENPEAADPETGETGIEWARIPTPLHNWRVLEIEGEATVVDEDASTAADAAPRTPIQEQIDPIVLATLSQRRLEATPGETAVLAAEVINNGDKAAVFSVTVEGWIDERWCEELPVRVPLQPGARRKVEIAITVPRQPQCQAGDYPLAVVARADRHPGRVTRLAAMLVIQPFVAFSLSPLAPRDVSVTWFRPAAVTLATLENLGNQAATFRLHAYDRRRTCDYLFWLDDERDRAGHAEIELAAGQRVEVPLEIRPQHLPLFRVAPLVIPFRLTARLDEDASLRRSVDGGITCLPLVGTWHLVGLAVLAVVALLGSGLAVLALLMALRSAPEPAAPAAPAPLVALVLKMDEPVPTPNAQMPRDQSVAPLVQPDDVTAPDAAGGEPPVVRPEQVTAPGEALPPAAQTPLPAIPAAEPPRDVPPPDAAARGQMTYAQMFQEIALRFDLDWRTLAATAYVESGFDSLALGSHGDLGLMQIQPATWNEWAPTLSVTDPFDSYSNTVVGAAYLDYLRTLLGQRGYVEPEWMLVAYNWGPDQLLAFLESGGTWDTLNAELRQYALDVLQIAATIPDD